MVRRPQVGEALKRPIASATTAAARPVRLPQGMQTIRFRLSLTYALTIFAAGAIFIGGIYLWQVSQLDEPILAVENSTWLNPQTGEVFEVREFMRDDVERVVLETFEYEAYRVALENLRKASFSGLAALFVVAFGAGWVLSGWALRPVNSMASVAREITGNDLARRISLSGPDDELKYLADTFDAMLDRLQGAFEGQRQFVQDASHELRNPLAAASANLELALSNPDATTSDLRNAAEVASRSTERMRVLVDDLLAQARVGVPQLTMAPVDVVQVVKDSVQEFSGAAGQREINLVADDSGFDSPGDIVVLGDRSALLRATGNLISNAVRLAPASSTITVRVSRLDDRAFVNVIDQGPGISPADQRQIFDRFWRGETAGSGTGLGLGIVKQIAERHSGSISVESAVGIGSTFVLSLPISPNC